MLGGLDSSAARHSKNMNDIAFKKLYGIEMTDNFRKQLRESDSTVEVFKKRNIRPKDANKILIICAECQKEILKYRSLVEKQGHKNQFCSRECSLKYKRKHGFNKGNFSIK